MVIISSKNISRPAFLDPLLQITLIRSTFCRGSWVKFRPSAFPPVCPSCHTHTDISLIIFLLGVGLWHFPFNLCHQPTNLPLPKRLHRLRVMQIILPPLPAFFASFFILVVLFLSCFSCLASFAATAAHWQPIWQVNPRGTERG